MIHKSNVIDPKAKIEKNVKIGPFCFIGPNVQLDEGVELISNVHIVIAYYSPLLFKIEMTLVNVAYIYCFK